MAAIAGPQDQGGQHTDQSGHRSEASTLAVELAEHFEQGRIENSHETARNMITLTDMDDAMIAKITGLTVEEVAKLREASRH